MNRTIDFDKTKESADFLRYLSLMGVQKANSGHPGLPLGCADLGILLYQYFLRGSSNEPKWANRDRFVLSAGHGSMLIYSLGYLYGYPFTKKDLASFRQVGSKTPGHPEYNLKEGIETTTGPLGQGFANAVGMAMEAKMLQARFNKADAALFDYNIYTLMGDGCTMEGVTNEAASIAGHHGLDNLIAFYDSNNITIDGHADAAMTEDVGGRYKALGWHVEYAAGSDLKAVAAGIEKLLSLKDKPKILIVTTVIGEGLNKLRGSHKVHGAPAGADEIAYFAANSSFNKAFKARYSDAVDLDKIKAKVVEEIASGDFTTREDLKGFFAEKTKTNDTLISEWKKKLEDYRKKYPVEAAQLDSFLEFKLPSDLRKALLDYSTEPDATRKISSAVLQICAKHLPQIVGGSADLVESTFATVKGSEYITRTNFSGRNIAFGIREHGMGAVGNGLALNGSFIPFTSTFFTFLDYMKPAVRLAAIMKLKHLFVFTHDSFYVGEDGPTHQPIEHLGSLRLVPGLHTFRPANDMETAFSYLHFLENHSPAVVLGSRQPLAPEVFKIAGDREKLYSSFKKGAYVIAEASGKPDFILAGSGSEVSTLAQAKVLLEKQGKKIRLVSMPCVELFEDTDAAYQKEIFPDGTPVYLAEAASHRGFKPFYRGDIRLKSMKTFGESGNFKSVAKHFGFTAEDIAADVLKI